MRQLLGAEEIYRRITSPLQVEIRKQTSEKCYPALFAADTSIFTSPLQGGKEKVFFLLQLLTAPVKHVLEAERTRYPSQNGSLSVGPNTHQTTPHLCCSSQKLACGPSPSRQVGRQACSTPSVALSASCQLCKWPPAGKRTMLAPEA